MSDLTLNDLDMTQLEALDFVQTRNKSGLFLVPGKGKTVIALTWAKDLLDHLNATKVLVIAPKLVAQNTWETEHLGWSHLYSLKVNTVLGAEKKRLLALRQHADVYAINPENVKWLVNTPKYIWDFDAIIVDESDFFQSHAALRFKALRHYAHACPHVMIMTGTPIGNSYMGLWAQINLIDAGERLGHNITRYRSTFFHEQVKGDRREYVVDDTAAQEIMARIQDICFSIEDDSEEVFPRQIHVHPVELTESARELYDQMAADFLIQVEEHEVTAMNAAAKAGKLLQIASGNVYSSLEPDEPIRNRKTLFVHDEKMKKVQEIVLQAEGQVLIFYNYISERELLLKTFPEAIDVRKDKQALAKWNAGDAPVMVAHPKSAGHGLNLQYGGHTVVFVGLPWSIRQYQQAVARLARKGQKKQVQVHHVMATRSLDYYVSEKLSHHKQTGFQFLKGLRESLKSHLHGQKCTADREQIHD